MKVVFSCALVLAVAASYALGECRKPNQNTKLCLQNPHQAVGSCTNLTPCAGNVYGINQFPDGTEIDAKGKTQENLRDCYRFQSCYTHPQTNVCLMNPNWSSWYQLPKVEKDGQCAT